jgi:hypothetical protein
MVNGYISFLKLVFVISCSQNRELIFCKNNEAIPRKGERLVLKSQHLLFNGQIERKQQIYGIFPTLALPLSICQGFFIFFY